MTPEQIEKERHAFEEWYGAPNPLKSDSNGNYLYASAHNALPLISGTGLAHFFTGDIYHVDGYEYECDIFKDVTHWQPLPEPPLNSEDE